MRFQASFKYAISLIFPKSDRRSSAKKSMTGAMICIGLSLIPIIVVLTVTSSMISGMTERIIGLSSGHVEAFIASKAEEVSSLQNFYAMAEEICTFDGVREAFPEVSLNALAGGKKERLGVEIRAVQPDIFTKNKSFQSFFQVTEGNLNDFENPPEGNTGASLRRAVIGSYLAEKLELHPGDTFRLITTKKTGKTVTPKLTSFTVSAVVTSGYQELDALWVFIPLETAYAVIPLNTSSFRMIINTDDAFSPLLQKVRRSLQMNFRGTANFFTWNEVNESEFENFSSTRVMLVFVMLLIVLVASVNISSALIMLAMERKKEIAILKSMGAKNSFISFAFLIAGTASSLGGIIIGLPLGLLVSYKINSLINITEKIVNGVSKGMNLLKGIPASKISEIKLLDPAFYLTEVPVEIPWNSILGILFCTILLSAVVSLVPAIRAGREKPNEILTKN